MAGRFVMFAYGVVGYLVGATAYFVGMSGFLSNLFGPYSIDQGRLQFY